MSGLDRADLTIKAARALRDNLANTVDVTILDQWLDRNAAYDIALRDLYAAYSKLGSKVTKALRDAIAAEAAARSNLPPDTRGLVVIMAEIGRGGMTGAVIAIEEARGRLTAAIDAASSAGDAASPNP
jgi:predicted sugar kinase